MALSAVATDRERRLLDAAVVVLNVADTPAAARAATSLANWMVMAGRADGADVGTARRRWHRRRFCVRAMARTAQAYAFAAAGRSPEGLRVLGFLPVSGNDVAIPEPDALIMRGILKVYTDDLPGAIADLGLEVAEAGSHSQGISVPRAQASAGRRRPAPNPSGIEKRHDVVGPSLSTEG